MPDPNARTALGRLGQALYRGAREGYQPQDPLGIDPGGDVEQWLYKHGVFGQGPVRALNEVIIRPVAGATDLASRLWPTLRSSSAAYTAQLARELGTSQGMSRRLERDLNQLGDVTALLGMTAPYRPPAPTREPILAPGEAVPRLRLPGRAPEALPAPSAPVANPYQPRVLQRTTGSRPVARAPIPPGATQRLTEAIRQRAEQLPGPVWRSGLSEQVRQAPIWRGTGEQWLSTLKNRGGVTANELEYTGIEQFLREHGKDVLTRDDVAQAIKPLQVGEVWKKENFDPTKTVITDVTNESLGSDNRRMLDQFADSWGGPYVRVHRLDNPALIDSTDHLYALERADGSIRILDDSGVGEGDAPSIGVAKEMANEIWNEWIIEGALQFEGSTQYGKYQLEGPKTNYRELLLTTPSGNQATPPKLETFDDIQKMLIDHQAFSRDLSLEEQNNLTSIIIAQYKALGPDGVVDSLVNDLGMGEGPANGVADALYYNITLEPDEFYRWKLEKSWSEMTPAEQGEATVMYDDYLRHKQAGQAEAFTQGHWREPNVVAHVRLNDRTDVAGNQLLFIEEVQSDWHQQARDRRFNEVKRVAEHDDISMKEANQRVPANYGYKRPPLTANDLEIQRVPLDQARQDDKYAFTDSTINDMYRYREDLNRAFHENVSPNDPIIRYRLKGSEGGWSYLWDPNLTDEKVLKAVTGERPDPHTALGREVINRREGLPDAPFKKNWEELAFKRSLRVAADEDKDAIAWTTGKQQAERYGSDPEKDTGFTAAYDQRLVNIANKFAKRYGVKVEDTQIPGEQPLQSGPVQMGGGQPGNVETNTVHMLKLTPEMKRDIRQGLTLPAIVAGGAGLGAAAGGDQTDEEQY